MADEDLEILKEKLKKDPLSKLFVPLAEEYKKRGMVDEAINILLNALENQPNYISAMVVLGKMYLHKGMLSQARDEFEKVINLIPYNLLAHKKLAEIYYKQGEINRAVREYQIILNLNPNDEEAKTIMFSLKSSSESEEPKEQVDATRFRAELMSGIQAKDLQGSMGTDEERAVENYLEGTKETPVYEIYEEVSGAELGIEIPERLIPVEEEPVSKDLEEFRKIIKLHSKKSSTTESEHEQPDNTFSIPDLPPIVEEIQENHLDKVVPTLRSVRPRGVESYRDSEDRFREDKNTISMSTETMADIFIAQGLYDEAMDIYKEILSADPENRRIIQRHEELKMLIKLKDKKT